MFASLFRASSGDDRSVFGDFWFTPIGARSGSGVHVTADSALRHTAVMAAVRLLANTMACLPFCLYRAKPGGGREQVTDDWRYRLFAKRPNRWQNAYEWRAMMQGHLELRGNAYNEMVVNGAGEVTELIPLHPDRVTIESLDDEGNYRFKILQRDGSPKILPREKVFHLRGLSSDGIRGVSTIEAGKDTIGGALAAQSYAARFFANDARPLGGWIGLQPGQTFKDEPARQAFRESWQRGQAGVNRGKTAVLENGMTYHEVGINNKDSQFIETLQASVSDIARLFGVPPHLIGDLSRATNNNIEQQSLEYATYAVHPRAELWEYAIEACFFEDDEDLELELDLGNLLRGDSAARAEYYSSGINAGWLTRNEARARENLDPITGLDEPLQPMNMVPAGTPPKPPAPAPAAEKEPDGDDAAGSKGGTVDGQAGVTYTLAARAVTREVTWLRKIVKEGFTSEKAAGFYAEFRDWLINKGVPETIATPWCLARADELAKSADIATTLVEWDRAGGGELAARCGAKMSALDLFAHGLVTIARSFAAQKPAENHFHAGDTHVSMPAPIVENHIAGPTVNVPEQPAPVVQNTVNVPEHPAPVVQNTVNVPEQPAPVVQNTVNVPERGRAEPRGPAPHPTETRVTKRDKAGRVEVFETRPLKKD